MIPNASEPRIILPSHNIFGDHGPRCPDCSGAGVVRHFRSETGRADRQLSRCRCGGTGVETAIDRLLAADRRALAQAKAIQALTWESNLTQGRMSRQSWNEALAASTADGTAVANTLVETIVFPNYTLPGSYMQDGRVLRLRAYGKLSTTGTPTIKFGLRWGGVGGTLLANTETITTASGSANTMWSLELYIQTRTNGATGTLMVTGDVTVNLTASTQTSQAWGVSGFDAPAAVTVDLTVDTALALTATWSAASASNTLTGVVYTLESLN